MLISFVWLYMFKCDVYAQVLADQTQKDFLVFYMFLKVILYFYAFSFCSKCIFVFFFKNWFRGFFARSSRLRASRKMCLREITKSHFSYRKSHYCLASILRLNSSREMFLGKNLKIFNFAQSLDTVLRPKVSRESFLASVVIFVIDSRLACYCLTREKYVFSVL